MAEQRKRKTKEELALELEEKLKKIKAEIKADRKKKTAILTKDSAGIADVISALEKAARENKTTLADVIKAVSSIKRTGLKIENAVRKPKA